MIKDIKLEPPLDCSCGNQIETYSLGYGRTPYGVYCWQCKLSLHDIMPSGVGYHLNHEHAIEAWNDYHRASVYLKENKNISYPKKDQILEQRYRFLKGWDKYD